MSETLPPIRRIVTGDDAQGRSRIAEDAPAPVHAADSINRSGRTARICFVLLDGRR